MVATKIRSPQNLFFFWQTNPIGTGLNNYPTGSKEWFDNIKRAKQANEGYRVGLFKEFSGKKVLEIGYGVGIDHLVLHNLVSELHGIDLATTSKILTRRYFSYHDITRTRLKVADATSIPYEPGSFDAVYSWGVLHHIVNVERAVAEIYRILKPGGFAILAMYNKFSPFYISLMARRLLTLEFLTEYHFERLARIERGNGEVYVSVWSKRRLRKLFKNFDVAFEHGHRWLMVVKATKRLNQT